MYIVKAKVHTTRLEELGTYKSKDDALNRRRELQKLDITGVQIKLNRSL